MRNKIKFSIRDVLQMDYPNVKHYGVRNGEEYIDCPFCGRKKKLNISYTKNVFRCNACDTSGGVLKLHMLAKGVTSSKQAYVDLKKCNFDSSTDNKMDIAIEDIKENKPFPDFLLNTIYKNLLENLELEKEDEKELLNRGLTKEDIEINQYKTYPTKMYTYLAEKSLIGTIHLDERKTLEYYSEKMESELGVPGYYVSHGDVSLIYKKERGFLIPIRNLKGEITSMQIRNFLDEDATNEEKEKFSKYIWFSSKSKRGGCGVHDVNQVHFTGFNFEAKKIPRTVFLTEDCLKADVASSLMKQTGFTIANAPFIAVMGVNSTAQLPKVFTELKDRGTEEIVVCFDMDYLTNPNVSKAMQKVIKIIKDSGLKVRQENWDKKYKGIDDYLLYKLKMKI